jgi:hypothetical protein
MIDPEDILKQPLLDEDGKLNPMCVAEITETINATGKTHERLRGDPEWDVSKDQWTFPDEITGAFAMWACRQSPYGVPDGLENVCKYLHACLLKERKWENSGMEELSLCEINKMLYDILYEQGVAEFDAWNRCKVGDTPDIQFTSAVDGRRNPDRDFIDLDALLHNVCLTIRDERRKNKAFDERFEKEHGRIGIV